MTTERDSRQEDRSGSASITLAEIRERAYDIWERNHRPEGFEMRFWLAAERELRAERTGSPKTDDPPPE